MTIGAADLYTRRIGFMARLLEMRIGGQCRHRMAGRAERIGRGEPVDFGAGDDGACARDPAYADERTYRQPTVYRHRNPLV